MKEKLSEYVDTLRELADTKYNVSNIIEGHIYNIDEVIQFYRDGKINEVEMTILHALGLPGALSSLIIGSGTFKLFIPNVPEDAYDTNIDALLNGFYSLYNKFPDYHFDKLLEAGLFKTSLKLAYISHVYEIVLKQLDNEKNEISPFELNDFNMFNRIRFSLQVPEIVEFYKSMPVSKYNSTSNYDYFASCEPALNEKGVSVFNK